MLRCNWKNLMITRATPSCLPTYYFGPQDYEHPTYPGHKKLTRLWHQPMQKMKNLRLVPDLHHTVSELSIILIFCSILVMVDETRKALLISHEAHGILLRGCEFSGGFENCTSSWCAFSIVAIYMSWRNSEILHSFVQAQPFEAEPMRRFSYSYYTPELANILGGIDLILINYILGCVWIQTSQAPTSSHNVTPPDSQIDATGASAGVRQALRFKPDQMIF